MIWRWMYIIPCLCVAAAAADGSVANASTTQAAPAAPVAPAMDTSAPSIDLVLRNGARCEKCRLLSISGNMIELCHADGKIVKIPGSEVQRIVFLPPEPPRPAPAPAAAPSRNTADDSPSQFEQLKNRYMQLEDKRQIERLSPQEENELEDLRLHMPEILGGGQRPPPPTPGEKPELERRRDEMRRKLAAATDNVQVRDSVFNLQDVYHRLGNGPLEQIALLKSDLSTIKDDKVRQAAQDKIIQEVRNRIDNVRPRNILKRLNDERREQPPPPPPHN